MMRQTALEVLDGTENTRLNLLRSIRYACKAANNIQPRELGVLAGLSDPDDVLRVMEGEKELDGATALALMGPLEVALDNVLPEPVLTDDEREYWSKRRIAMGFGPVGAANGDISFDEHLILGLFIRYQAMQELR
jgi:hypothetical protein